MTPLATNEGLKHATCAAPIHHRQVLGHLWAPPPLHRSRPELPAPLRHSRGEPCTPRVTCVRVSTSRKAASGRQPSRELRAGAIHTASLRMDTVLERALSCSAPDSAIPRPPLRLPVYAQAELQRAAARGWRRLPRRVSPAARLCAPWRQRGHQRGTHRHPSRPTRGDDLAASEEMPGDQPRPCAVRCSRGNRSTPPMVLNATGPSRRSLNSTPAV